MSESEAHKRGIRRSGCDRCRQTAINPKTGRTLRCKASTKGTSEIACTDEGNHFDCTLVGSYTHDDELCLPIVLNRDNAGTSWILFKEQEEPIEVSPELSRVLRKEIAKQFLQISATLPPDGSLQGQQDQGQAPEERASEERTITISPFDLPEAQEAIQLDRCSAPLDEAAAKDAAKAAANGAKTVWCAYTRIILGLRTWWSDAYDPGVRDKLNSATCGLKLHVDQLCKAYANGESFTPNCNYWREMEDQPEASAVQEKGLKRSSSRVSLIDDSAKSPKSRKGKGKEKESCNAGPSTKIILESAPASHPFAVQLASDLLRYHRKDAGIPITVIKVYEALKKLRLQDGTDALDPLDHKIYNVPVGLCNQLVRLARDDCEPSGMLYEDWDAFLTLWKAYQSNSNSDGSAVGGVDRAYPPQAASSSTGAGAQLLPSSPPVECVNPQRLQRVSQEPTTKCSISGCLRDVISGQDLCFDCLLCREYNPFNPIE